ncbi:MAG: DUF1232 domain-containing protein [Bacteroidetes bacterium]|nr:DUF1232 domain-containing protein [Bacteroidota bacterium]HET6243982.1 DUF1232 domain-containing protein [Bacteroidia bacterium]
MKRSLLKIPFKALVLFLAFLDRQTPFKTKILLCISFLYLIIPFDFIPDFIPLAGWVDDLIVVPSLLAFAANELPPFVIEKAKAKASKYRILIVLVALLLLLGFFLLLGLIVWLIFF